MSSKVIPGFNIYSPYSGVVKYVGRENKGFFVKPTNDVITDGWGSPFTSPTGAPIVPGTPGGAGPVKFIGKGKAGSWRCVHAPGTHFYGEISWLGKRKHPTIDTKGKHVLTYHGPNTRYFPIDSFKYGDDEHNNVYYEGLCIAVAPFPVLGAALREYTIPAVTQSAPGGGTVVVTPEVKGFRLVVICKENGQDSVYIREVSVGVGVNTIGYTSAFRNTQMELFSQTAPKGWRLLGKFKCTVSSQGITRVVMSARTPWFFDYTGTFAQCMREAEIEINRGDKIVKQNGYVRYKIKVSDDEAELTIPDNTNGYTISTSHIVEDHGIYVANTRYPPQSVNAVKPHRWRQYKIKTTVNGTGNYVVAVDYNEAEECLFKVEMLINRTNVQWMYKGQDNPTYGYSIYEQNNFDMLGDLYPLYLDPSLVPAEGDGTTTSWVKIDDTLFAIGRGFDNFPLYRRLSGSQTQFVTGSPSATDTMVYFVFDVSVYPHYYSLARPHISFYTDDVLYQYNEMFVSKTEQYYEGTSTMTNTKKFMEKTDPGVTMPYGNYTSVDRGWLNSQLEDYWLAGVNTTHTFNVIDAQYPMDFVYPTSEPDPADAFYNFYTDFATTWPTIQKLLQSVANNYRPGGHAEDSLGNFIMSMEYTDENGDVKYYNILNGDPKKLDSLTKASGQGLKYFPLGET